MLQPLCGRSRDADAEEMLQSGASRRDADGRCSFERATAPDSDAAERLSSVRERMEATVSGLKELEYLRHRQEVLVHTVLEVQGGVEEERQRDAAQLSSEEKLLEENILLLRKQLVGSDLSAE